MNKINSSAAKQRKNEIVITRIFDAPRELVWKAWTEPEHCKKWWAQIISQHLTAKLIFELVENILIVCVHRKGKIFGVPGSIAR